MADRLDVESLLQRLPHPRRSGCINSRLGYRETIKYATRISTDGIYLHELDSAVWAQRNTDTSHGCLNLNADTAIWFYKFCRPGDVVEVRNTGGPPRQITSNCLSTL